MDLNITKCSRKICLILSLYAYLFLVYSAGAMHPFLTIGATMSLTIWCTYSALKHRRSIYIMAKIAWSIRNSIRNDIQVRKGHCVIEFYSYGTKYHLLVPYDMNLKSKRRRSKVYLHKGEELEEYSHYPGVPILLSPERICMDGIRLTAPTLDIYKTGSGLFDQVPA